MVLIVIINCTILKVFVMQTGKKGFILGHLLCPLDNSLCDTLPPIQCSLLRVIIHSHVLWLLIKVYTEFWISDHHTPKGGDQALSMSVPQFFVPALI